MQRTSIWKLPKVHCPVNQTVELLLVGVLVLQYLNIISKKVFIVVFLLFAYFSYVDSY